MYIYLNDSLSQIVLTNEETLVMWSLLSDILFSVNQYVLYTFNCFLYFY